MERMFHGKTRQTESGDPVGLNGTCVPEYAVERESPPLPSPPARARRGPGGAPTPPDGPGTDDPPSTLDAMHARLEAERPDLSRRLEEVAAWVLAHPESVALDTLAEIADKAGVHPSTLVRFAHRFGFGGFSELQRLYRAHVHEHFADYGARIRTLQRSLGADDGIDATRLLGEFTEANLVALERLRAGTDPDALDAAVELLDGARAIHVCGIRRAFPVAMYFAYALPHIGLSCHAIDGLGLMHAEQARCVGAGEVLVAITFSPYAEATRAVIRTARDNGAKVILLTDAPSCPSAKDSDVLFTVRDAEVRSFRSLNASLCLAQTLCIALGFRREGRDA